MRPPSQGIWSEKSAWAIVAANAYVLFGVLFLGWDAGAILVLYWSESIVIGAYTVLKMAFACGPSREVQLPKFNLITLFVLNYGIGCLVHGVFIMLLTRRGGSLLGGATDFPQLLLRLLLPEGLGWPLAALYLSHGISFVENYLVGKEYRAVGPQDVMAEPFVRIGILHVTVLMGGAAVILLGSPVPLVAILVALKTVIELWLHWRSHAKLRVALGEGVLDGTGTDLYLYLSDEKQTRRRSPSSDGQGRLPKG